MADTIKNKRKQRIDIAKGLLWKEQRIDDLTVIKTMQWISTDLKTYYSSLIDWVVDYENASEY